MEWVAWDGAMGMEGSWRQREETEGAGRDTGNTGIEYQKCSWRYWKWKGSPGGTGRDSGLMWCAGGACWRQETARGAVGGTWDTLGVIGGCVMGEEPPSPGRVHAPPESSWVFLPAASAQEGLYLGKLLQAAAPATFSSPGISRDSPSLLLSLGNASVHPSTAQSTFLWGCQGDNPVSH